MKQLLLFSLLFAAAVTVAAQATGKISYSMDFASDNPDMAMALPMMKGSVLELSFVPGKSKVDMAMGTFMKMNTVVDAKAGKSLLLMEVMGNKTATEINIPDANTAASSTGDTTIEQTAETKDIIGFKCIKTIIRSTEGTETIMWIAKDLKAVLQGQKQFVGAAIEGVPLEFSTVNNGMNIHLIATKFDKTVDESIFSLAIPEGYNVVTEEELKQIGQ